MYATTTNNNNNNNSEDEDDDDDANAVAFLLSFNMLVTQLSPWRVLVSEVKDSRLHLGAYSWRRDTQL